MFTNPPPPPPAGALLSLADVTLVKGHATRNDFLVLTDPTGKVVLTSDVVAWLCDRRAGIGADGLIRVTRPEFVAAAPAETAGAEWFMDYYNADGTHAEMCGNGARSFLHRLHASGLAELTPWEPLQFGTRGGLRRGWRQATAGADLYTVDMGPAQYPGGDSAVADGHDVSVQIAALAGQRPGLRVAMPNPHVVVALESVDELNQAQLVGTANVTPVLPEGANLELVVRQEDISPDLGAFRMRVLERGVGETASCGTGCCAAAAAVRLWDGPDSPDRYQVTVPGGQVEVRLRETTIELTGDAVEVAYITLGVV